MVVDFTVVSVVGSSTSVVRTVVAVVVGVLGAVEAVERVVGAEVASVVADRMLVEPSAAASPDGSACVTSGLRVNRELLRAMDRRAVFSVRLLDVVDSDASVMLLRGSSSDACRKSTMTSPKITTTTLSSTAVIE